MPDSTATDEHGQLTGGAGNGAADPAPTDTFTAAADWPDPMPDTALTCLAATAMGTAAGPREQLRDRGFCQFRNCFSPEFIEELRLFVDEGEQGVSKYYPAGTADFSRPSGEGNVFQGDQVSRLHPPALLSPLDDLQPRQTSQSRPDASSP